MLSLCQCFSGSILALSVCFAATSPIGRGTGVPGHSALDAQGPIGRKRAGLAYGGSGQQDASDSAADAGSRNPGCGTPQA